MIFANIMANNSSPKKYRNKLLDKYRFVIMTDNSFEEKLSIKLSRLNIMAFLSVFVFSSFFVVFLLVLYTPLNEYVPSKSDSELQEKLIFLSLQTDSLKNIVAARDHYLSNLENIIRDTNLLLINTSSNIKKPSLNNEDLVFKPSAEDSLLRITVEAEDNSSIYSERPVKNDYLVFFPPVRGLITDDFNSTSKHFGIDVVATEKSRISSVLDGSVVVSHWTAETGFVIMVQHKNDYLSVYKHNSSLLKSVGDFVLAGEHIAVIGNSGELSSGPHLHFELWHKGLPVNPQDYIVF